MWLRLSVASSRAALLTGCYPNQLEILGALSSHSKYGIHENEMLIPELVKQRGYATAMYLGNRHLGHRWLYLCNTVLMITLDLPYSNDMWPHHPTAGDRFPDLPTIEKNDCGIQFPIKLN